MKLPLIAIGGKRIGIYVEKPKNEKELINILNHVKRESKEDDYSKIMIKHLKTILLEYENPLDIKNKWIKKIDPILITEIKKLLISIDILRD